FLLLLNSFLMSVDVLQLRSFTCLSQPCREETMLELSVTLDDQAYLRSVDFISYFLSSFGFASSRQFPAPVVSWTKPAAPKKPSTDSPSLNLDPESLYPWRPDHSYLAHHYRPPLRCVFQGVGVTSALHNASFHCSCRAPNSCQSSLAERESC
ncbi:hypothetical protein ATANTOWER_001844, partial [Ataeniobius toweri]|nr:hypothetical protein [Ataeniobius toweri]